MVSTSGSAGFYYGVQSLPRTASTNICSVDKTRPGSLRLNRYQTTEWSETQAIRDPSNNAAESAVMRDNRPGLPRVRVKHMVT